MSVNILGTNTAGQFRSNTNKFREWELPDVFRQSLSPFVTYTDDPEKATKVKDTFAVRKNGDEYVIIEYEGLNLKSEVLQILKGVI